MIKNILIKFWMEEEKLKNLQKKLNKKQLKNMNIWKNKFKKKQFFFTLCF